MNEHNAVGDVDSNDDIVDKTKRNKFSSTFSTYLTALGYSVGMSDIWRFPFLAFRNGGGAFLIPFFTMIIVCGIPMYFLEYSIGKFSGKGPYKVWDISPLFRGLGITVSMAYLLYMTGTSVFRCWIIEFIVNTFRDPLPWSHCDNTWNTASCRSDQAINNSKYFNSSVLQKVNETALKETEIVQSTQRTMVIEIGMTPAEEFWQYKVLQLSPGIYDLYPVIWWYFLYMAVLRIVIFLGSIKSIKSIEKVIYVTGILPLILTVAIFIRSMMLPGFSDGVKYFFYPEFLKLTQPRVWIEATLMAFYTLGFGWGANVLIGSHADFKDNSLRAAVLLPVVDAFVAAFSGLVCFAVLGNMAYAQGIHIKEVINAGMAAGVVAYITALSLLPVPQLWSAMFLISLLFCGIESQLIPIEMVMQLIGDCYPRLHENSRTICLALLSLLIYLFSLFTCTGAGAYIFLWIDWYGGTWAGPIVAFCEIMVVAWVYGLDRFNKDVYLMIGRSIPALLRIAMAFIAPLIVVVIFGVSIVNYVPPKYGAYTYPTSARLFGWLLVLIATLPIAVKAFFVINRSKGTFLQRIKREIKPLDEWGPCEDTYILSYKNTKRQYRSRTFSDLFHYNLFGSYPKSSIMSVNEINEMKAMKNDM